MKDKQTLDRLTMPPKKFPDAQLTIEGWVDATTGELLMEKRTTQEEVEHFQNRHGYSQVKQKHTNSTVDADDSNTQTTTETLTPSERDQRQLLEETPGDEPASFTERFKRLLR